MTFLNGLEIIRNGRLELETRRKRKIAE